MKAIGKISTSRRQRTITASAAPVHAGHHPPHIRLSSGSLSFRKSGEPGSSYCAFLETQIAAWEREREKASKVDIRALLAADRVSGSTFAPPWSVEIVEPDTLDALEVETTGFRIVWRNCRRLAENAYLQACPATQRCSGSAR